MPDDLTSVSPVVIVGAGHAGVEAAYAVAQMGLRAVLVTLSREKIAEMPCNPAIGGLAKGHIVCEVDALGGLMGRATDATGIQFRMLNRSKGPAVWGPRAQADKRAYSRWIRQTLESHERIELVEGQVVAIGSAEGKVHSVTLAEGRTLPASAVIVTTGTFLDGRVHIGDDQYAAGRIGEPPAVGLSDSLRSLGLTLGRLKTGTCPRLAKNSIDYSKLELQPGDEPPTPFSFMTDCVVQPQVPCHVTWTTARTHDILRASLDRAPLYTGQITSTGPRYCPSIEVKIVRFSDKERHQIFIEPESLEYDWVYCNGLATSVPRDVQLEMVHSIAGLEHAEIVQDGYAIEYDYVPPDQLTATLQTKAVRGLFCAGQINGTSGYEEAAGQGIVAGINAGRYVQNAEPMVLGRDQAYIGVLIDDLVTKGVDEPYRMFTSRAEFRLLLRFDTAARRLTPLGRQMGTVDDARWQRFQCWQQQADRCRRVLSELRVDRTPADRWLRRPESSLEALLAAVGGAPFAEFWPTVVQTVVTDCKYEGYEEREARTVAKMRQLDRVKIPTELDYGAVLGLRIETRERLERVRPMTLGQASRIIGVTPADVLVLMVHLNR
jgi:tRNA uridine 5-carboxymethylaminomethyl modification enzyme